MTQLKKTEMLSNTTLYADAAVLKPYDMQCTSLGTLHADAAVLKPYDK
jgi:hypothetical protein